ncbi:hypothetical protein RKD23_000118 [Streptomyces sp. SAI-170]
MKYHGRNRRRSGVPLMGALRPTPGPKIRKLCHCGVIRSSPADSARQTGFDANAEFIAVVDGTWSAYSLLAMREGYINRLVVLDQATMAGTTWNISPQACVMAPDRATTAGRRRAQNGDDTQRASSA